MGDVMYTLSSNPKINRRVTKLIWSKSQEASYSNIVCTVFSGQIIVTEEAKIHFVLNQNAHLSQLPFCVL